MATQIPFVDELTKVMESLKSHKRFSLRSAAIASILVGSILNFVSLLAVFVGSHGGNAPRHLTAWTSVVVRRVYVPVIRLRLLTRNEAFYLFQLELYGPRVAL